MRNAGRPPAGSELVAIGVGSLCVLREVVEDALKQLGGVSVLCPSCEGVVNLWTCLGCHSRRDWAAAHQLRLMGEGSLDEGGAKRGPDDPFDNRGVLALKSVEIRVGLPILESCSEFSRIPISVTRSGVAISGRCSDTRGDACATARVALPCALQGYAKPE